MAVHHCTLFYSTGSMHTHVANPTSLEPMITYALTGRGMYLPSYDIRVGRQGKEEKKNECLDR